jgi:hypothetical protein
VASLAPRAGEVAVQTGVRLLLLYVGWPVYGRFNMPLNQNMARLQSMVAKG